MEKPITVRVKEMNEGIVKAINNANLPAWKVRDELNKILAQVNNLAIQEEERELAEWAKENEIKENENDITDL